MPYRGRAVKKLRGQRKLKQATPVAKFTLTKVYTVRKGASTDNAYVLDIDASTPFSPINARNGDWQANDTVVEPFGLGSDVYSHYNHLVVLGCKVSASVRDAPDFVPDPGEDLSTGQLSLIRASAGGAISGSATASSIKTLYGHKTKGFQLSPRMGEGTNASNVLTKSAYCSLGYSAKKTWNANPLSIDDLRVTNSSGSSNKATDSTHINVVILPQADILTSHLQPLQCVVKMEYIIAFQEPTRIQTVPLPMTSSTSQDSYYSQAKSLYNKYAPSSKQMQWVAKQALAGASMYHARRAMYGHQMRANYAARRGLGYR